MKGRLKVLVLAERGKNEIKYVRIERIFNKNASWKMNTGSTGLGCCTGKKDLDDGFDEILVVALDRRIREKIENELKEAGLADEEKVKLQDIHITCFPKT
jgi:hypothetical protein